ASGSAGNDSPASKWRSRRQALAGAGAAALLFLALLATFLLWQISDRVDNLEHGRGNQAQTATPPPLPPASGGGGRAILREFDALSGRITRPLGAVLGELQRGQLYQISPALYALLSNTRLLPTTVRALNTLIFGTGQLGTTLFN